MKLYKLMLLFICSTSFAGESVRMVGEGPTSYLAQQDAFRKAIEYKIGVMVLSEKEVRDDDLVRNDILSYSAGYVEDFKIVTPFNGKYLVLDVIVNDSKVAKRLYSPSTPGKFDGSRHSIQLSTIDSTRKSGLSLIDSVLNDFPYHAFDIKYKNYEIYYDRNMPVLRIPITISWNKDFNNALKETLYLLADKKGNLTSQGASNVVFVPRPSTMVVESLMMNNRDHFIFNDATVANQIKKYLVGDMYKPYIKVNLLDRYGKIVQSLCRPFNDDFFNTTKNYKFVIFYEKTKQKDFVDIVLNFPVNEIEEYELKVVRKKECF
jgi:hypothetical protein